MPLFSELRQQGSRLIEECGGSTNAVNCPITVIMPAHNAKRFIAQAVGSVLGQTYQNFKLWILENGSTDKTLQIARSIHDERITVFELGKVGFQGALDFAIHKTTTPWLAGMDADDLMFPERLERQMAVIRQNPKLSLVGTHHCLLTPFGHVLDSLPLPVTGKVDTNLLATRRGFADPSVVFNREAALEVGGMDSEFEIGDVVLWFRLLAKRGGWQIGEPLHLYRLQPGSHSREPGRIAETMRAKRKYVPNLHPNWTIAPPRTPFWAQVAGFELVAGDRHAVRRCAHALTEAGFQTEGRRMVWRARAGVLGKLYYAFRNRHSCRHRPDLERELSRWLGDSNEYPLRASVARYNLACV